jgi:Tol biopolymer transport system component
MGKRAHLLGIPAWLRRALAALSRRAWPLAAAAGALVVVGALGALLSGVWRTEGEVDPASVFHDLPEPQHEQAVPLEEPLRLIAGIYRLAADGRSLTHIADEPGKNYDSNPTSLSADGRWLVFAPAPPRGSRQAIFLKDLSTDSPAQPVAAFALVYALAISPDGGNLIVHGDIEPQKRSWPDISPYYLIDVESQTVHPLPWLQSSRDVMWSPDGSRLSFTRPIEGGDQLVVSDVNGKVLMMATIPYPAIISWSPDGSTLAIDSFSGDDGLGTYLMDRAGNVRMLTPVRSLDLTGAHWSPDGRTLLFGAYDESVDGPVIAIVDVATGASKTLTAGEKPAWSSDGTRLAFIRDGSLLLMNADGTKLEHVVRPIQPLVDNPEWVDGPGVRFHYVPGGLDSITIRSDDGAERHLAHGLHPTWSPDGARIAFIGRVLSHGFGTKYEIWVMNGNGSDAQRIGEAYTGHIAGGCSAALAWASDGTRVVFGGQPSSSIPNPIPANDSIQVEDACRKSTSVDP